MMARLSPDNTLLPHRLRQGYLALLNPAVAFFARHKIHPNVFTILSFLFGCTGGALMASGLIRLASVIFLLSGILDNIDGNLARKRELVTRFGALFDSTLDRYSETLYFLGIAFYFTRIGGFLTAAVTTVGMIGSLMVSYVRARAEGLGYTCNVGFIQRPERVVLLGLCGLIHRNALIVALWIIAILSNATAIQRIIHVWKSDLKHAGPPKDGKE